MTDKYFLDTNILVYAFDKKDVRKQNIAKRYLDCLSKDKNYVLSLQVLNEFCNVAFRKLKPPMPTQDISAFISSIPKNRILPLTKETTLKALKVKEDYMFSFWDSLIVSAAIIGNCNYVLTENISHSQKIETVTIINPFLVSTS